MSDNGDKPKKWKDVTQQFKDLAKKMKEGDLEKSESFTLYDSLSALELFTPKMDPGYRQPVSKIVKDGEVGELPSSYADVVDLCRSFIKQEKVWLEGESLLSSLFSCYLISEPTMGVLREAAAPFLDQIRQKIDAKSANSAEVDGNLLHASCYALIVATFCAAKLNYEAIVRAEVYFEEDFNPYVADQSFDIFPDFEGNDSLASQFVGLICRRLKAVKDDDNAKILLTCLQYKFNLLKMSEQLVKYELQSLTVAMKHVDICKSELNKLKSLFAENNVEENPDANLKFFDPFLCAELLGPAPPRKFIMGTITEALEFFSALLVDLSFIGNVANSKSLRELHLNLQVLSFRNPNVMVRSHVVPLLYSQNKEICYTFNFDQVVTDDMVAFGVDEFRLSRSYITELVSTMVSGSIYEFLRAFCYNKSRLRRSIISSLGKWRLIHAYALYMDKKSCMEDNEKRKGKSLGVPEDHVNFTDILSSWVNSWIYRMLLEACVLGTSLELYTELELEGSLWVTSFLAKIQSEEANRVRAYQTRPFEIEMDALQKSLEDKTMQKAKKKDISRKLTNLASQRIRELEKFDKGETRLRLRPVVEEGNYRNMLLFHFSSAMLYLNFALVEHRPELFTEQALKSKTLKYHQRFGEFKQFLSEQFQDYDGFMKNFNLSGNEAKELLDKSLSDFEFAKSLAQQVASTFSSASTNQPKTEFYAHFLRISIQNIVTIKMLLANTASLKNIEVRFEKDHWVPVLKIKQ